MDLPSYFTDFLQEIRPRQDQLDALRTAHLTLRQRIREDADLSSFCLSDFLQGSYRRSTAVRPLGDEKADVDVIIVTNLDHQTLTPDQALDRFKTFLDCHYEDQWRKRGRSIQISLAKITLDLVVTASPSEAQKSLYLSESVQTDSGIEDLERTGDSQLVPTWADPDSLMIPDRDAQEWQQTNPLAQIRWTWGKNKRCGGRYVNVVKAVKWWRRQFTEPEHPKSYPLEHLIGDACPDGISSVAEGVTRTLEIISSAYQHYADTGTVPCLRDRGVERNVFLRITPEEFSAFHALAKEGAVLARKALDAQTEAESAAAWRELFGNRFPAGPEPDSGNDDQSGGGQRGGYSSRMGPTVISGGRFA